MQGKIVKGIGGFYYVDNGKNKVYACRAKGIFRKQDIKPLVGDNVEFTILDETDAEGNVDAILPRKNALIRPAAANVDQALVVFALTHPAPNLNLLDRFLVMMEREQVPVIICFNKADLAGEEEMEAYRAVYEKAGYPVRIISAKEEDGVEAVRSLMRGKTTVLAGPSGVGKSTLHNALLPGQQRETGGISQKLGRGRHTTREVELLEAFGGLLADTPGFASLDTSRALHIPKEELQHAFPEFAPYFGKCRFTGCAHMAETGCAVKQALEEGKIEPSRYESYAALYEEAKDVKEWQLR